MSKAPTDNGYQLTSDDYENIWLRVKERGRSTLGTAFFGWLTLAAALGALGGHEISKRALEAAVKQHTQTGEFRENLTAHTRQQIPALQADLDALELRAKLLRDSIIVHQEQLAALQRTPNEIDILGARWTSPDGRSLRLQTGRVRVGGLGSSNVVFSTPFAAEPVVLVSLNEAPLAIGRGAIVTKNVTTTGMEVESLGVTGVAQWVAIGQ